MIDTLAPPFDKPENLGTPVKGWPRKKRILRKLFRWIGICMAMVLLAGLILPAKPIIPVAQATPGDWNHQTYWHEPWGASGVHKGIDVFSKHGQDALAATSGVVIAVQDLRLGGKTLTILGPKWRVHYYAHLSQQTVHVGQFVRQGQAVGKVGTSGNAAGKAPHLHYAIVTLVPYPWRISGARQGWKKAFFLNPHDLLTGS